MMKAALVLLSIGLSGCAATAADSPDVATAQSAAPGVTSSPSASTDGKADPVKYAQCMRENGMTWFPDPDSDGRMTVAVPRTVDQEEMKKAEQACREWSPMNGEKPQLSAEDLEKARQMSKCMRENGVPNFPDPNADGSLEINGDELGTGPGQEAFDSAEQACSQYLPKQRSKERGTDGGDGA
ncbi:hypothetical protein ACTI_31410 [Actinoplanes sp. OR16]|uniref:hypothetical protein n=1 Tax=Actinoplanes sp. OR16 TaxID=946334 RepID=UPI000F6C62AB|nr:hypothetical protein [Actinoplanes sp. OR16]BBH66456.1 hypothetical protein ACTI_31410 [Actinoplanes sp. OR16]